MKTATPAAPSPTPVDLGVPARLFAVAANPLRLTVLAYLAVNGPSPRSEVAEAVGAAAGGGPTAFAAAVRVLGLNGLLARGKRGQESVYGLTDLGVGVVAAADGLGALAAALSDSP